MRPPRGRAVLAVVFWILALNAFAQVLLRLGGGSSDPAPLVGLQVLIGAAATAAGWGSWAARRWAPWAALAHGLVTAGMLLALMPLLDLGREARGGLWTGAAAVLLFDGWAAWYLRRRRPPAGASPSASGRHHVEAGERQG